MVVVAALCNRCSALVVAKDGPIQTVADLKGRKIGYVPGTSGSTQVRLVSGSTSSGGTWIAAARGLGAIHGGFLVQVTCPSGQDPQTLYGSLRADKLVIVVGPGL